MACPCVDPVWLPDEDDVMDFRLDLAQGWPNSARMLQTCWKNRILENAKSQKLRGVESMYDLMLVLLGLVRPV